MTTYICAPFSSTDALQSKIMVAVASYNHRYSLCYLCYTSALLLMNKVHDAADQECLTSPAICYSLFLAFHTSIAGPAAMMITVQC